MPQPQLVRGRMDVGHQPAVQPRPHPLLDVLQIAGRLVGGEHDLPVLLDQRVEGVEELVLGRFLAADELDVVDHQDVDGAELLLEVDGVLGRAARG